MPAFDNETMVRLSLVAIILLAALPIHEFSHALIAYRLGDGTAKLLGRLTLNPIVHFDPVGGTILILTLLIPGSGFIFGWAKPTPVNPTNLRGGRQSDALVALAGPASNLIMATAAAIPFRVMMANGMDSFEQKNGPCPHRPHWPAASDHRAGLRQKSAGWPRGRGRDLGLGQFCCGQSKRCAECLLVLSGA